MTLTNTSIRQSFGQALVDLARVNQNIYVVDVDLRSSLSLSEFASIFPQRFIEAGVAENNATSIAAGLAKTGKTVFLTSFSCFSPAINWATIKQSICYNQLNVKIIGSHSGLASGSLGASHQMLEDVCLTRCLPGLEVFAPADSIETKKIVKAITYSPKPAYFRLVRPDTPDFFPPKLGFTIGKSHLLTTGNQVTILFYGPIGYQALSLCQLYPKLSLEIINCSSIKPLDTKTILKSIEKTKRLIVLEDHQKIGGLGEAVSHLLLQSGIRTKFIHLGVNNIFGQSAPNYQTLYSHYGISQHHLLKAIQKICTK